MVRGYGEMVWCDGEGVQLLQVCYKRNYRKSVTSVTTSSQLLV